MRKSHSSYYRRDQRKGRKLSALMHIVFFAIAYFGLPSFMFSHPPEERVITVELLPITGITNVKPADKPEEAEKPEEKKSEAKPSPPVKTSQPIVAPPEPKKSDLAKDKEKQKKPEPKKEEKPKKAKEDDLAAVLRAVKETAQKEEKKDDKKDKDNAAETKSTSQTYNPGLPMSLSEKDAIMSQLARCWNVPAGARDAQNLVIVLNAEYNSDGSYLSVELARESMGRYATDTFFRAAADAAIRAVKQCSPLVGLPPEKYQTWRLMELQFDPKLMLN